MHHEINVVATLLYLSRGDNSRSTCLCHSHNARGVGVLDVSNPRVHQVQVMLQFMTDHLRGQDIDIGSSVVIEK